MSSCDCTAAGGGGKRGCGGGGEATNIYDQVREYYGKVLGGSGDLRTSACTACGPLPPHLIKVMDLVPEEVKNK